MQLSRRIMNKAKRKYSLLRLLWHHYKLNRFRNHIRLKFPENDIIPMNVFPEEILSVGKGSYGEINVVTFSNSTKLEIGNYVSIAQHVTFLLSAEHNINTISTYPFKVKLLESEEQEAGTKGGITVEDDVWIGFGCTIMSGVTIGQGAIVAAGSIVTKNVEPYTIVGGVPAKKIKDRFSDDLKQELCQIDFGKLDTDSVSKHINELYAPLVSSEQLSWLAKK